MSLRGYDLSNHNSAGAPETVEQAFADGAFIIHKATEGRTFKDAYHHGVIARARDAGKLVGHYHYPHPGHNSVDAELAEFLGFATPRPGDVIALDFEPYGDRADGSIGGVHLPSWILAFGAGVFAQTGASCWLYLNGDWGGTVMAQASAGEAAALREMPLWKATQGQSLSGSWFGWPVLTCWQWDASDDLDKDVFYGTADAWRALGVQEGDRPMALTTADVRTIFGTDGVIKSPDGGTNAYWTAGSYLVETFRQARAAQQAATNGRSDVAALAAALASTTARVNEVADAQAALAQAVAELRAVVEGTSGDVLAVVGDAVREALDGVSVGGTFTLAQAPAQP